MLDIVKPPVCTPTAVPLFTGSYFVCSLQSGSEEGSAYAVFVYQGNYVIFLLGVLSMFNSWVVTWEKIEQSLGLTLTKPMSSLIKSYLTASIFRTFINYL